MKYDVLLLGATTLACAWAEKCAAKGEKVAVLEEASLVGYDYSEAWRSAPVAEADCPEEAKALYAELKDREAVNAAGIFHLPAVAPVLCKKMKDSGADCFFFSRVKAIARGANGFVVTATSLGGDFTLEAAKIVDTTSEFASCKFFGEAEPTVKARTLSFCMTHTEKECKFPARPGCFGEGDYAEFEMQEGESLSAAVHRLVVGWNSDPAVFGHAQLIRTANYPTVIPTETLRAFACDAVWAPSTAYADPMQAYAAGCRFAEKAFTGAPAKVQALPEFDDGEVDLLVAGLGTAGAVAAIYGAKRGLKVLGIENLSIPGGAGTAGEVRWYFQGENKNGFYREIDKYMEVGAEVFVNHPGNGGGVRKLVALEAAFQHEGVRAVYHALACEVLTDGEKNVVGLRYLANDGYHTVHAKQTIDATADGVLCRAAGCEMMSGRAVDGRFTPFSSVQNKYTVKDRTFGFGYTDCGVVNQYDTLAFGKAILAANSDEYHLLDTYGHPVTLENTQSLDQTNADAPIYMGTALLTGLREGERIVGEEIAKLEDFLNGVYTDHPMFYMFSNIDAHNKDYAFEDEIVCDWLAIACMWGWNVKVPLPAGILIPKGWKGLLVAGRHLSCDQGLSYGLRMMDDMCRTAEAAVLMAEYAIHTGNAAKDMPYEALREGMMAYSALCPDDAPAIIKRGEPETYREGANMWETDPEKIKAGLMSDCYGYALWSARMMGEKLRTEMNTWLNAGDYNLQLNAALALTLAGFPEGEPRLLDGLHELNGYISTTSCYNMLPRVMAVIACCGKLGLRHSFLKINEYFTNPYCTDTVPMPKDKLFKNREDLRFQYRSFAFVALMKLNEIYDDMPRLLEERMYRVLTDPEFTLTTTMMGNPNLRSDLMPTVRKIWNAKFPNHAI